MTEIESLKKTMVLWIYLTEHPYATKLGAYRALQLPLDLNDCPLCEFARYETKRGSATDCSICPLKDLWPAGCCKYDSPYGIWCAYRGRYTANLASKAIIQAAKERLEVVS